MKLVNMDERIYSSNNIYIHSEISCTIPTFGDDFAILSISKKILSLNIL